MCFTYGEYRDRQSTVFIDQPGIDMFQSEAEVPRSFQVYKDQEFYNVEIKNMDFSNSKFIELSLKLQPWKSFKWMIVSLKIVYLNR